MFHQGFHTDVYPKRRQDAVIGDLTHTGRAEAFHELQYELQSLQTMKTK